MVQGMTEGTAAAWSRRRGRARARARVLAGLAGAAGLAGILALAVVVHRNAAVVVQQCLPGDGLAGWLGVRLALLRPDAACPEGALALGADGRDVVGVTVMVAVPVLLAHLTGAGVGLGLLRTFGRAVRSAVELVAGVLLRIPRAIPTFAPVLRAAVVTAWRGPHRDVVGRARWRRGPPVPLFA